MSRRSWTQSSAASTRPTSGSRTWPAELDDDNREGAWRILRPISKTLRDELTVDEAAQLAAQLPLVLRGAFYEGFDPGRQPAKLRHRDEFLARLAERARLPDPEDPERAAEAARRCSAAT
jgi:uncharacterized protein (DUF2267 family)